MMTPCKFVIPSGDQYREKVVDGRILGFVPRIDFEKVAEIAIAKSATMAIVSCDDDGRVQEVPLSALRVLLAH